MKDEEANVEEKKENSLKGMEAYLKSLDGIEDGQLVTGTVVQVNNEFVFVDVGYKSEGKIPVDEFDEVPQVGDTVKVLIINKEGRGGQIIVSKKSADAKAKSEELKTAFENKEPVEGKFVKVIKGGYEVNLGGGFLAFCPLSKADVVRVEEPESLLGVRDYFLIDKFENSNRVKSVVSRKGFLDIRIKENREKFFETVQVGDVVEGTVKSFTNFGAFIDLGGFDGLLHNNDLSWGRNNKVKDFIKRGDKVRLRVIKIDTETKKINLSLKHMEQDPWDTFEQNYKVGDVIHAPVTKLLNFGAFIEIKPGLEGLAHVSELSWNSNVNHPKDVLSVGQMVDAEIMGYDLDAKRVSLSLKNLMENPWNKEIPEKYAAGTKLNCKVVKTTSSGAFLNIEPGLDGFLHVDDISWTKKIKNISSFCKEGDMLDVCVISVDNKAKKIRLGIKQLESNPWMTLRNEHPKFSTITGTVTSVSEAGVVVKIDENIEGFIPKHQLQGPDEEYSDSAVKSFKAGDSVTAMVMDVNTSAQKLSLSIKEMLKKAQQEDIDKYMSSNADDDDHITIADLIKVKEDKD